MIYFISDLHLYHNNVIRFDNRPYENLEEMHESIINNWNSTVTKADTVYICGDVSFKGSIEKVEEVLRRLNGKINIIRGNHDLDYSGVVLSNITYLGRDEVAKLNVNTYRKTETKKIHMCHFPIAEWDQFFRGSYHIFGHIHSSKNNRLLYEYIRNNPRMLNCGAPVVGYTPKSFKNLIEINNKFYEKYKCIEIYRDRSLIYKTENGNILNFEKYFKSILDWEVLEGLNFNSVDDMVNKILGTTEEEKTIDILDRFLSNENEHGEIGTINVDSEECNIVFY